MEEWEQYIPKNWKNPIIPTGGYNGLGMNTPKYNPNPQAPKTPDGLGNTFNKTPAKSFNTLGAGLTGGGIVVGAVTNYLARQSALKDADRAYNENKKGILTASNALIANNTSRGITAENRLGVNLNNLYMTGGKDKGKIGILSSLINSNSQAKETISSQRASIIANRQMQLKAARDERNRTKRDIDNSGSVVGDVLSGAMQALPFFL